MKKINQYQHPNLPPELWQQMLKDSEELEAIKYKNNPAEYLRPLLKIMAEKLYEEKTGINIKKLKEEYTYGRF